MLFGNLLLSLLVAVRDQPVEEAAWSALRVVLLLCAVDLTLEMTGGLVVDVVVVVDIVDVCYCEYELCVYTRGP